MVMHPALAQELAWQHAADIARRSRRSGATRDFDAASHRRMRGAALRAWAVLNGAPVTATSQPRSGAAKAQTLAQTAAPTSAPTAAQTRPQAVATVGTPAGSPMGCVA